MDNTIAMRIVNRINAIKELPICQLELRQPMLVDLLVMLVDHETENGALTQAWGGVQSQKYWQSLKEYAKGAGFEFLGAGHFSAAFKHGMLPGKVIKIGFKKEDSGAAYAAYCRANAGAVGLPVIHALARHKSCYSVVLDELISLERSMPDSVLGSYSIVHEVISYKTGYAEVTQGVLTDYQYALAETARDIRKFFDGVASFDLHTGNVMMTQSGALVITDPVSYSNDEALKECDFDSIMDEIAALRLKEWAQGRLIKWQKKHPSTEVRAMRKRKVKARRRQAKRKARQVQAMLNDPMLTGPVFVDGQAFERPEGIITGQRRAMKEIMFAHNFGAGQRVLIDCGIRGLRAHAHKLQLDSAMFVVRTMQIGPRFEHPRIKRVKARNPAPEGLILKCTNWNAPKRNGFLKVNK